MRRTANLLGLDSHRSLLAGIAILAALATALAMFFSLGARPAAAQDKEKDAAQGEIAQGEISDYLSEEDLQALAEAAEEQGIPVEELDVAKTEVSKDPEGLKFGDVEKGTSSSTQNATVNVDKLGCVKIPFTDFCIGSFPAKIASATVSGQGFAEVSDNCEGNEISTACSVGVKFQPNSTGAQNGQLTFTPGKLVLFNVPQFCIPPLGFPCVNIGNIEVPTQFTDDTGVDLSGNGTPPPDTIPPSVTSFSPTGKNVGPGANARAKFSEDMLASSITAPGTFTLIKKGSTTPVPAVVTYDPATDTATLNPNSKLKKGATYTAKVTTAATDDANPANALDQEKTWKFTVKR